MANKFSQGTVVSAGAVIAGVDADNPPVTSSTPSPIATSVTDASFISEGWSASGAVVDNANFQEFGEWISYGTLGSYGTSDGKEIVAADGSSEGVHYLRYDPVGKKIWALVLTQIGNSGGPFGVLQNEGFTSDFIWSREFNNLTLFSGPTGMSTPTLHGTLYTYEPEEVVAMGGIIWTGTTWNRAVS